MSEESKPKRVWVYDLEQLINLHTATFIDRNSPEKRQFVISNQRNDAKEYMEFLTREVSGLIGFNNLNFDYPLLHFLMSLPITDLDASQINQLLFDEAQRIIEDNYTEVPWWKIKIPQLDVYRIHHFDNRSRSMSLKATQVAINFPNVEELSLDVFSEVEQEDVQKVLDYNENDVLSTKQFYQLTIPKVELRKELSATFNLHLLNASDPKIGSEILFNYLARADSRDRKQLRRQRTYRSAIAFKDCILSYIKFNSKQFSDLLERLKSQVIVTTKKAIQDHVIYKGFRYDYGTGGIHGCIEPGIYKKQEDQKIVDIDVKSYYPAIAIVNNFYPQHLGQNFCKIYEKLFKMRMRAKKEGNKPLTAGLKLALNGVYGKSNDKYSYLYDPQYTMSVTLNGQLLLSMLAERIVDSIDCTMIQINTDGLTVKINREDYEQLKQTCAQWEIDTKLMLEFTEYEYMVIRDVNNYIAVDVNGEVKLKGCFEIDKTANGERAYWKDNSMRIVPIALKKYYVDNIPVEETVRNHDNIYDFCLRYKAPSNWTPRVDYIDSEGNKIQQHLQKTVRYYVSDRPIPGNKLSHVPLLKQCEDGRLERIEAGYSTTLFNQYFELPIREYNINYSYYIYECRKIMMQVDDGQRKLF